MYRTSCLCKLVTLCLLGLFITRPAIAQQDQTTRLIREAIVEYKDFPKSGIDFMDVGGILKNPPAFKAVIDNLVAHYKDKKIEAILAVDSRGFLFATPLAYQLNIPVIMVRKPGKLPGKVISSKLTKEYGEDIIEMQQNALSPKQRVIIIDDLVATGGTLRAAINLARMAKAEVVEVASIIELTKFRNDRNLTVPVYSVIQN